MTTKEIQKRIYDNKVKHDFNLTDINQEFCYLYGEVGEAYEAWSREKGKDELGLELADVAIYLLGLAEILGYDLGEEIEKKMVINAKRVYRKGARTSIKTSV